MLFRHSSSSVKAYGDGALGSLGAALIKPYSYAPRTHGLLLTQPEDMDELYTTVLGSGFQLNYHHQCGQQTNGKRE